MHPHLHLLHPAPACRPVQGPHTILQDKCEIWRCIHHLVEAANISPQTSLALAIQALDWLPTIPCDLSYCVGIPVMFAYGLELYQLQSWSAAGDMSYLLDSHAQTTNLLSHKLACRYNGVGDPHTEERWPLHQCYCGH